MNRRVTIDQNLPAHCDAQPVERCNVARIQQIITAEIRTLQQARYARR